MDWYDGKANCTIGEAFAKAPRMPPKPSKPSWDNEDAIARFETTGRGGIFEIKTMDDRMMHTHTCSGHCFVWNAPNQLHEDGFRLYTYRSKDGWGRVSILAHTLDTLIAGTGGRMYCGNWRLLLGDWGARRLPSGEEIVLLDYDCMYVYGDSAVGQDEINTMKQKVLQWYKTLPLVDVPAATDEELAREIVRR